MGKLERPRYKSSSGDEIVYAKGEWKVIQNGKTTKILESKRFCLEKTLAELNLDFKCLDSSKIHTLSTSDGTDDGKFIDHGELIFKQMFKTIRFGKLKTGQKCMIRFKMGSTSVAWT